MNFKKYTKAELISKIKSSQEQLENKINKLNKIGTEYSIIIQIKSFFTQIWELILVFKNILIKLTLISFLIQLFRKYRLFRKLWLTLNTIVMSIFGISLLDNFGIEFISNFIKEFKFVLGNTLDYLTNTHFYKYLTDIFLKKGELPSSEKTNNNRTTISREDKREPTDISEGIR
jgi:hypothetical protein